MIVLSSADVVALLPIETAIEVVAGAMVAVSAGKANLPLRSLVDVGGANRLGIMPGALAEPACYGVKLLSLFPDNPADGYSSHEGAMVLFEARHGMVSAMVNAGPLTAIRTAAASAVATRTLARPDASVLAIVGTGEQADHHIDAMLAVRPVRELRIAGRTDAKADALARKAATRHPQVKISTGTDIRAAVEGADIVCTVTAADEPILSGEWIAAGTHLNVVGSSIPSKREIDEEMVARAAVFVDYRPSTFAQAGEVIRAIESGRIGREHVRAEIGEVLAGTAAGRAGPDEITLYRSLGIAAQDLACAVYCVEQAKARRLGVVAPLD